MNNQNKETIMEENHRPESETTQSTRQPLEPQAAPVELNNKDEHTWAMACHLSALVGFFIPFGAIIGPFVIWLIKKDEMPLVEVHGKKSLNFQLTLLIAYVVCFMLMFVVIGVILLPLVAIFSFIMVVIAAVKTNDGKEFSYPMTINFIK